MAYLWNLRTSYHLHHYHPCRRWDYCSWLLTVSFLLPSRNHSGTCKLVLLFFLLTPRKNSISLKVKAFLWPVGAYRLFLCLISSPATAPLLYTTGNTLWQLTEKISPRTHKLNLWGRKLPGDHPKKFLKPLMDTGQKAFASRVPRVLYFVTLGLRMLSKLFYFPNFVHDFFQ